MDDARVKHLEMKALLFFPVLMIARYLASLAAQFTCFLFGHDICGGYGLEEIPAQIDFAPGMTERDFGFSDFSHTRFGSSA